MPKHDAINRLTSRTFQYLLPSWGFLEPLQVQGGGCRETPDGKQNIATGETSQSHHFTPFLFTSFHFYVFSNFFGSYQLRGDAPFNKMTSDKPVENEGNPGDGEGGKGSELPKNSPIPHSQDYQWGLPPPPPPRPPPRRTCCVHRCSTRWVGMCWCSQWC